MTKDFTLRYAKSGRGWATCSIAINKFVRDGDDKVMFLDLKVFSPESASRFAENVSESLTKGTRVTVTGKLEAEKWQGNDGVERTSYVIVVDSIGPDLRWASADVSRNPRDGDAPSRYTKDQGYGGQAPAAPANDPFTVDGNAEVSPF
ncbi:MAG: single-stranded DNA-binding protein [Actinomycetia bacterium]|nr:single-stranded DNA-binding protein [Actinomycetes bacterium]MCP4844911.1 single-stranded DNA-binding protein [Actinomycetes bacterium]